MSTTAFDSSSLVAGDELPATTRGPISVTDFVRYQGASGDMNPIHHDTEFAQASGFPTPFAVGMLQAGQLGTFVTDLFGAEAIRSLKVQFREQAWPGDVLRFSGRVATVEDGVATLELACTRVEAREGAPAAGGDHLRGTATVVVG